MEMLLGVRPPANHLHGFRPHRRFFRLEVHEDIDAVLGNVSASMPGTSRLSTRSPNSRFHLRERSGLDVPDAGEVRLAVSRREAPGRRGWVCRRRAGRAWCGVVQPLGAGGCASREQRDEDEQPETWHLHTLCPELPHFTTAVRHVRGQNRQCSVLRRCYPLSPRPVVSRQQTKMCGVSTACPRPPR